MPENPWLFPTFLFHPLSENFWDTQYKTNFYCFALIKKSSYKPLLKLVLDIIDFFLECVCAMWM